MPCNRMYFVFTQKAHYNNGKYVIGQYRYRLFPILPNASSRCNSRGGAAFNLNRKQPVCEEEVYYVPTGIEEKGYIIKIAQVLAGTTFFFTYWLLCYPAAWA